MGRCLEAVGVQPYRTVDTYGRETFHPWSLDYTLFSNRRTKYELHPKVAVSAVGLVGSVFVASCCLPGPSHLPFPPPLFSKHVWIRTRVCT